MKDAELIYSALLRAERRAEDAAKEAPEPEKQKLVSVWLAVSTIREEIGNGLALEAAPASADGGIAYSPVWVAYVGAEDRFYLVDEAKTLALPTPPELHGHLDELLAAEDARLGCHAGFVPWPRDRDMDAAQIEGAPGAESD